MSPIGRIVTTLALSAALVALTAAAATPPSRADHDSGLDNATSGQQAGTEGGGDLPPQAPPQPKSSTPPVAGTTGPGAADPSLPAPAAPPALGRSVSVAPAAGTVMVTLPGSSHGVPLARVGSIPVGARVDARHGAVQLTSAVDASGTTDSGTFWGGVFTVRQPRRGGGYTELVLAGGRPSGCAKARHATISRRRDQRVAKLWGKDHHGRFRTRGQNSVATVRGTRWVTIERCAGTFTHVTHGAVSVRDLRAHRTVTVRAHHSYLARYKSAG